MPDDITWVLEPDVFGDSDSRFREAVLSGGHGLVTWKDTWWASEAWPRLEGHATIFRGSLANADAIRRRLPWRPGAYCDTQGFSCSSWYPRAARWLLHDGWSFTTAASLAADPGSVLASLGDPDSVFVRPDSPLKPFSGRVLQRGPSR